MHPFHCVHLSFAENIDDEKLFAMIRQFSSTFELNDMDANGATTTPENIFGRMRVVAS